MNQKAVKAYVYNGKGFFCGQALFEDKPSFCVSDCSCAPNLNASDFDGIIVIPGLIDVHVHLREPGFFYKESIKTGTMASARGGYTAVCSMPNLNPVPDCKEGLRAQQEIIDRDAVIAVCPYGAITKGQRGEQLSDMQDIANDVIAFSDDGKGVQTEGMMEQAMLKAKALSKMIVAHCEVNHLLKGGYIHDGEYARAHGHKGICSRSEWEQIARDVQLCKSTGCAYHVCHISTKESVEIIRKAKAEGVNITCETAPHYLILSDKDLIDDGRFKMNPPLRGEEDRLALIEGIVDGTIDMIATDHAPHSKEEKSKGLAGSNMGIVGIETAFALSYTYLVKTGIITLEKLVELLSVNPAKRFGIKQDYEKNFTVMLLNKPVIINSDDFLSKGKSTPFIGNEVKAQCLMTVYNGGIVWKEKEESLF